MGYYRAYDIYNSNSLITDIMSYIDVQSGSGIGADALQWVSDNPDKIAKAAWDNRAKIFQYTSNAQRYVSKNITRDPRPIRYLKSGEMHLMNHNFTGPGTRVDLPEVKNHAPYNNIDACSKVHDLEFHRIFKMPLGQARSEAIRAADKKVLECYDRYPSESGYRLASTGINSKIRLEDLSPAIFDQIMGKTYRGVEPHTEQPQKKRCKGRNRKKCLSQSGGAIDPITAYLAVYGVGAAAGLYSEYQLGKYIYSKYRSRSDIDV